MQNDLSTDVGRIAQGLSKVVDKLDQHETLLLAILEAVSVKSEEDSPLVVALKKLIADVEDMPKHFRRPLRQILQEVVREEVTKTIRKELDRVVEKEIP